jgi:hypothetical protein
MGIMTPAESKSIGHDEDLIYTYPTLAEVEGAARLALCRWYRYLRSPHDADEATTLNRIIELLQTTYPK